MINIVINAAPRDPAWDDFLASVPGGQHVQTSLWAQVKAELGWRAIRIQLGDDRQLIAGAQLLLKPLSIMGALAYLPQGPLLRHRDDALADVLLGAVHRAARAHRVRYLVVQPSDGDSDMMSRLSRHGFRPSALEVGPTATMRIDVTQDLDTILAQMKAKTRYNIRHGERRGITVREGTGQHVPLFYQALVATSQRQGFMPIRSPILRRWRGYLNLREGLDSLSPCTGTNRCRSCWRYGLAGQRFTKRALGLAAMVSIIPMKCCTGRRQNGRKLKDVTTTISRASTHERPRPCYGKSRCLRHCGARSAISKPGLEARCVCCLSPMIISIVRSCAGRIRRCIPKSLTQPLLASSERCYTSAEPRFPWIDMAKGCSS